jgi:hypothetical protein
MWCLIKNKIPTWDRIKNRKIEGPGWCPLCKGDEETGVHHVPSVPFCKTNLGRVLAGVGTDVSMAREFSGRSLERLACPTSE